MIDASATGRARAGPVGKVPPLTLARVWTQSRGRNHSTSVK